MSHACTPPLLPCLGCTCILRYTFPAPAATHHCCHAEAVRTPTHLQPEQPPTTAVVPRYNKEQAETELQEVLDALREEEEQRSALQDQQQALHRELEAIRGETAMARASAAVAAAEEVSVAAGADVGGSAADAARLGELEVELEWTTRELEEASSRCERGGREERRGGGRWMGQGKQQFEGEGGREGKAAGGRARGEGDWRED